jgi:hypothetical protein
MADQEDLKASERPQESSQESWTYPDAFDTALRELYERSFAECALPLEVVEELRSRQTDRLLGPAWLYVDCCLSEHTAEMWAAGRLDLTAESLMLSDRWRPRFPARWIQDAGNRRSALACASDQQALLDGGSAALAFPDWRLEETGYAVRILDKRAYAVFEHVQQLATMLVDELMGRPWVEQICGEVLACEQRLLRTPFLHYKSPTHRHQLFCESCRNAAPIVFALNETVAAEQFRRMRLFLANLVQCLDGSDLKIKKIAAGLGLGVLDEQALTKAVRWRTFFLVNYLPYIADMFVYCPKPRTAGQAVNPWTALRGGDGDPGAVTFVQSLAWQEFEAAVFAQEILSAIPDYPDCLAFRWKTEPISPPLIPSSQEGLMPIPGFLNVREDAGFVDWSTFLSDTVAEEESTMTLPDGTKHSVTFQAPSWDFDLLEGLFKLAAKAAKMECGLEGAGGVASERLDIIEAQAHAIYGAQRPMWELQEDTKRTLDHVADQQNQHSDILLQIRDQLSRPTKRHAEGSLRKILGETVFDALTDEAKTAVLEGELRFLQGEYLDPSVIPGQFAKAFECQLLWIIEPFLKRRRAPSLGEIYRMLEQSDSDFVGFLRENGFDCSLLRQKLSEVIPHRNRAAHQSVISEQRAIQLRRDWLGVGRAGASIFAALEPKRAAEISKNEPRAGTS